MNFQNSLENLPILSIPECITIQIGDINTNWIIQWLEPKSNKACTKDEEYYKINLNLERKSTCNCRYWALEKTGFTIFFLIEKINLKHETTILTYCDNP